MVSKDMLFLRDNKEMIAKEYEGRHIAISKGEIVAVGMTIHEVYQAVKNMGVQDPLVFYVPKVEEEGLLI